MKVKPENFVLEESLGYYCSKIRGYIHIALDDLLTEYDLSSAQAILLLRIAGYPDMPAATMCRLVGYDTGAMTRMLDKLEDKHLITRNRSETDRRVVKLNLTDAGREMCARLPDYFCQLSNTMLADVSEEEYAVLIKLLARVFETAVRNWGNHDTQHLAHATREGSSS